MTHKFNIQDEQGNTAVHNATYESNTAEITRLYHLGASFDIKNNNGDIPLFIAAKNRQGNKLVQALFEASTRKYNSSDVQYDIFSITDKDNNDIIFITAKQGNAGLLKAILEFNSAIPAEHHIDINALSYNNNTVMDIAAHFNHSNIIELLLQYTTNMTSTVHDLVFTAFDIAIEGRSADAVTTLQKKIIYSEGLSYRDSPLFYAVFLDYKDIAKVLIDNDPALIGRPDKFNRTVLHEASRVGNQEMIDFLILRGVDQNQVDSYNHTARQTFDLYHNMVPERARQNSYNTAQTDTIHKAVQTDNQNIVLDMIKQDPRIINMPDQYGKLPLHYARNPEIVKILCNNTDARDGTVVTLDRFGETPLHLAVSESDVNVVNEMFNCRGSDIDVTNKYGIQLIHYAAHWVKTKAKDMIDLLAQKGADINAPEPNNYNTPLHIAAGAKNLAAAKALIEKNVGINPVNMEGETPLHISTMRNDPYITRELVDAGANKSLYNNFKESPIELAQRLNFTAISLILGGVVSLSTLMPIILGHDKLIAHKANDDHGLITIDNDTSVDSYVAIGTVVTAFIAAIGAGVTWYARKKNSKKAISEQGMVEMETKPLAVATESISLSDDDHFVDMTGEAIIS